MMRTYKRKSDRGKTSETLLHQAANAVINEEKKVKTVARELDICHMTLRRCVNKLKAGKDPSTGYKCRTVFTVEQEKQLVDYILKCSSIYFDLLPGEVRKLAYECAVKFNLNNIPPTAVFSPKLVKPLPKAPPRVQMSTKRLIRKTAVLTDTPEKNALAEEQSKKAKKNENVAKKGKGNANSNSKGKEKVNSNSKGKAKGKGKTQENDKRRVLPETESDSEKDLEWHCIICCDSYSNSRPREQWIECTMCKNWAHVKCLNKGNIVAYVCPNCDSGEEMSDERE